MSEQSNIKRTQKGALSIYTENDRSVPREIDDLRPSIDAYLLAAGVGDDPNGAVLELGSGVGPVVNILAKIYPGRKIAGLDNNIDILKKCRDFILKQEYGNSINLVAGDVKNIPIETGCWDWVISNPPYRREKPKHETKDSVRKALFECSANLKDFVKAACNLVHKNGIILFIMDSLRKSELVALFQTEGWGCFLSIPIKNTKDGNAIRYLLYFKEGYCDKFIEKVPVVIPEFSKCLLDRLPKLYEV